MQNPIFTGAALASIEVMDFFFQAQTYFKWCLFVS